MDVLDLRAAKWLLLGFERRLKDNLEARMNHPDDPARFADSELALHDETDRLRLLAGAPELFPDLVPLGLASSLSSLLTHDNADLAAAAASLLADLTDSDDPSDLAGVLVRAGRRRELDFWVQFHESVASLTSIWAARSTGAVPNVLRSSEEREAGARSRIDGFGEAGGLPNTP